MEHKTGCLICGSDLIYHREARQAVCRYCGRTEPGYCECAQGHYICDTCHSLSALEIITLHCNESKTENPLKSALMLMNHPSVKMHGPEHHFLVPAVMLSSYCNIKGMSDRKGEYISKARTRAEKVPGGFCGYNGACGAAIGAGIFVSVISGATPLAIEEWKLSNLITSEVLRAIALHGGPRCCKRSTFLAIIETDEFMKKHFQFSFSIEESVKCTFSALNRECRKAECPFYTG